MLPDSPRRSTAQASVRRPRKSYTDGAKIVRIPKGTEPISDSMAMFLSELLHRTALTEEGRSGYFVDLPSNLLRSVAGGNYKREIKACKDRGYVTPNDSYSTELHICKSYRLESQYRTGEWEEYRLKRAREDATDRIRIDPCDEVGARLVECLAEAVIPQGVTRDAWSNFAVQSIYRGEIYATRCPYRRFHTTYTALPKSIRSQIELGNRKTVELDVSNCQALCLGLIAAEQEGREQRRGRPTTYHMLHDAQQGGAKPASIQKFIECCEAGALYETWLAKAIAKGHRLHDFVYDPRKRHMFDKVTGEPLPNRDLTRDDVKGQCVRMIFCELWKTLRMPLYPIFEAESPGVAAYVLRAKSAAYTGLPQKVAYKELAKDCQHLESSVMIDQVAATLSHRFPLVTIHDSIIVPQDREDEATREIKAQFARLGVNVHVKSNRPRIPHHLQVTSDDGN